ncbi:MAG: D-2-hydroxyacid dehydrogenase [Caulobacterales bacterium]
MRILLHKDSAARIRDRIPGLGFPVELFEADKSGVIAPSGSPIASEDVAPEVVWLSNEGMRDAPRVMFGAARHSSSVRFVQGGMAGLDSPVVREIFDRGVKLANSDAQAIAIAEYTLSQVVGAWYPFAEYQKVQAAKEWREVRFRELSQSRWLIIGYGNIGREIAKRAKGFGAHVTGVRRATSPDQYADEVVSMDDMAPHLAQADIVVLSIGLNDRTRDMADAAFFAGMKPGALLVNIGRGALIVEDALIAALDSGRVDTAILDVVRVEPAPQDHPFWTHPRVRLTAHTSHAGSARTARGDQLFLDNLKRYAEGKALRNEVTAASF